MASKNKLGKNPTNIQSKNSLNIKNEKMNTVINNLMKKKQGNEMKEREREKEEQEEKRRILSNKLIYYSKINDWEKAMELLSCKEESNQIQIDSCDESDWTALHFACNNGNVQLVTVLLNCGADVDLCTNTGQSALMLGAQKGAVKVVHQLLLHNPQLNTQDIYYNSALHYACLNANNSLVEMLLDQPDIDITL